MSPKTTTLAAGLTALGLCWSATRCVARQDAPPPPTTAPSASPSPSPTVILLSNGKVLRGEVSEDESGYVVKQKVGPIRLARRDVERAFGSIEDVYKYKRDRLPKGDPDEHMTLARWCLSQDLKEPARDQLRAILALSEDHPQARAMLAKLDAAAQREARRDPGVLRTGGPGPEDGAPRDLPPDIVDRRRRLQAVGPPVVFDLPPVLAARRYQEFAATVHPALQRHCAGCHNERADSKFQLMQTHSPRVMKDPLLLRTNLDATLRLVDPENPPKSELLINAVMPHGTSRQPVLSGPNHPAYRALASWVNGLRPPGKAPEGVQPAGLTATPPATTPAPGGFAADRLGGASQPAPPAVAASRAATVGEEPAPHAHPAVPADADFRTVTPMLGSGPDTAPVGAASKAAPAPAQATTPGGLPPNLKPLTAQDLEKLGRKSRPKPIDPNLLQKVMGRRNANP